MRRVKESERERERAKREGKGSERKVSGWIEEERRSQKEKKKKRWMEVVVMLCQLPFAFATWSPRGYLVPLFVCLSIYTSLFFFCAFSFLDGWSWVSAWIGCFSVGC